MIMHIGRLWSLVMKDVFGRIGEHVPRSGTLGLLRSSTHVFLGSWRRRLGVTKGGLSAVGPYPIVLTNPFLVAMLGIFCQALSIAHGPSRALFPHPHKALLATPDEGS